MNGQPLRRRSRSVNLVLVGVAGTAASLAGGCSGGVVSYQRNVYNSVADCARDYSAGLCQSRGYSAGTTFVGPVYRLRNGIPSACRSDDPGAGRRGSPRIGTQIDRGGFGVSCSRRSSSRSSSGRSFWGG
jgi:hypothetical protein